MNCEFVSYSFDPVELELLYITYDEGYQENIYVNVNCTLDIYLSYSSFLPSECYIVLFLLSNLKIPTSFYF